jgi:tetratricopeptide (TPR) repeat protein
MHDQLYRIRLYKLVKLLCQNIRSKARHIEPSRHESIQALEPDEETIDLSEESIATARDSRNSKVYCAIGRAYMEKGDYDQALNWFREGISIDPTFAYNYTSIGELYNKQKLYKQALYWFKKALKVSPRDHHYYGAIATVFRNQRMYPEAIDFFTKEKAQNPVAKDFLLVYGEGKGENIDKKVKQWLQDELERIIPLCAKYNVGIIFQSYPDYWGKYIVDDAIRMIANKHGIPFVHHGRVFSRIQMEGISLEQYFVPDGHPNARGYGVMATNIYNTLQESNVLKLLKDL